MWRGAPRWRFSTRASGATGLWNDDATWVRSNMRDDILIGGGLRSAGGNGYAHEMMRESGDKSKDIFAGCLRCP
eukprot:240373-Pyramimonas_sp.AAC.1